ncbi:hypothetical protein QBC41DRAFT_331011 [Cercophora samala]|uniref:Uncharacterized protein n=1 Tax=Cercophora samala TaxID=330535 RepID=A0AA39YYD0_9PEZI|nr:hypothetical protein QBC41DRAFT_331011 [Cercophora samala]
MAWRITSPVGKNVCRIFIPMLFLTFCQLFFRALRCLELAQSDVRTVRHLPSFRHVMADPYLRCRNTHHGCSIAQRPLLSSLWLSTWAWYLFPW